MAGSIAAKEVVTKVLENGQVFVDLGLQTPVRPTAAEGKSFDGHEGAKLCALDADLRAFLGEQQEAVELVRDLKQILARRR
ncbi:hypothetical protein AK812_SmicGene29918 [Symbiodinium microadriaticum]|uniref:Uncharacterized protein n=1 Tax=Symbiodinium microadriaticum TaxID=2951 RepID=A0A1Q9D0K7_SYMMI|nr:hypothetical protein AK812_SmicGene29918 [Symbiodinium microadriaticum]